MKNDNFSSKASQLTRYKNKMNSVSFKTGQDAIFPKGFKCFSTHCGIKKDATKEDLSVFLSECPATACAVFTKNKCPGAPIILGREIMKHDTLQAIVVNSGISNVGTGQEGLDNAKRIAKKVASECHVPEELVLMSSTGLIAHQLPIEKIERSLEGISQSWTESPVHGAKGIMTTDSYAKALSTQIGEVTITIVAKGSGMIEPNMATMLSYIFTDAKINAETLKPIFKQAVNDSFNCLSIDTDTSTSDTVVIIANGIESYVDIKRFKEALTLLCINMTEMLARDAEGSSKLLRVHVHQAASESDAKIISKSVVNSPEIKTMILGGDPNVGRILMAVGKCVQCEIDPEQLSFSINDVAVYESGQKVTFDEPEVRNRLNTDTVDILINLNQGNESKTAYGCDLGVGYIEENASYYSS